MLTCSLHLSTPVLVFGPSLSRHIRVRRSGWLHSGGVPRVNYEMNVKGDCSAVTGVLGGAGDRDNLCLSFPDALPSYCFGSGLSLLWLEILSGKRGAGLSRRPLVWSALLLLDSQLSFISHSPAWPLIYSTGLPESQMAEVGLFFLNSFHPLLSRGSK